jgi:flagellar hook-length control protein FliK
VCAPLDVVVQAIVPAQASVLLPTLPAAEQTILPATQADAFEVQKQKDVMRLGAAALALAPLPAEPDCDGMPEPSEAAVAQAAPVSAAAAHAAPVSAVAGSEVPAPNRPESKGLDDAVARLASVLGPAHPPAASAKTGAAQASTRTKAPPGEGEMEPGSEAIPGSAAGKAAAPAFAPQAGTPVAAPARSTESSEADAKPAASDSQPVKADGPAIPFPTLSGADLAGPSSLAQPASSAAAPAVPAHVVNDVPLGSVPVEIGLKSLAGINQFEIRLAPEDLGRIDVKLHIDGEGKVKAHLVVDRPETLAFLQRDAAQLQQTLEQAGLKTQDNGLAMSLRNSPSDPGFGQNRGGTGDDSSGRPGRPSNGRQAEAADSIAAPSRRLLWPRATGIDLHI